MFGFKKSDDKKDDIPIENKSSNIGLVNNQTPTFSSKTDYKNEETISEKKLWQMRNIFIAFGIFVLFVIVAIIASGLFLKTNNERLILWTILCVVYAIILYFLLEPKVLREVQKKEIHTINKEVPIVKIKEVPVDREVIKEVIKEVPVDREVIREVKVPVVQIKEVNKPVYIKKPSLNIPHYDYVGSMATKTYHKSSCRLGKSIKRKYKEFSNEVGFFKSKGYAPCKSCITKQVKV